MFYISFRYTQPLFPQLYFIFNHLLGWLYESTYLVIEELILLSLLGVKLMPELSYLENIEEFIFFKTWL